MLFADFHSEQVVRLMTQPQWRDKAFAAIYLCARYYAAFTLFRYGFAKVMGAQFTVLDSELAKPMGEVSGFWLTWYYFGMSPFYGAFVAGAQVAGALLLCFRRTALIGTLILLPVMLNIVSIDHWVIGWDFGADPLQMALAVLFALLVVLAFHSNDLFRFFLQRRENLALLPRSKAWTLAAHLVIVLGMLLYTAHNAYYMANENNRSPTAIDGAWHLVQAKPDRNDIPEWIYFEYNRAYMVVLKYPDGKSLMHDFRIDPKNQSIQMAQEWLSPGSDVFNGKWTRTGDRLVLDGTWGPTPPVMMTFQRKQMPVKDHQ